MVIPPCVTEKDSWVWRCKIVTPEFRRLMGGAKFKVSLVNHNGENLPLKEGRDLGKHVLGRVHRWERAVFPLHVL